MPFTSPAGAKANLTTMRAAFAEWNLKDRITFEIYRPDGTRVSIKDEAELSAQRWLFE